jgi:membrane protein implicated in regulation of membrane protease activity
MVWWLWVVLGMFLLALEMATPGGLFALFLGLSAIVVGILTGFGVAGPPWLQWLLFSILSFAALAILRGPLRGRLSLGGSKRRVDSMEGESATVTEEIPAEGVGKVELRGSSWNARTASGTIPRGQRCLVERVEGLTVWVRPE